MNDSFSFEVKKKKHGKLVGIFCLRGCKKVNQLDKHYFCVRYVLLLLANNFLIILSTTSSITPV